jgi:pectate lyase
MMRFPIHSRLLRHIYSNYFDNVLNSAVDSRDGAQTLIEDNQFTSVRLSSRVILSLFSCLTLS